MWIHTLPRSHLLKPFLCPCVPERQTGWGRREERGQEAQAGGFVSKGRERKEEEEGREEGRGSRTGEAHERAFPGLLPEPVAVLVVDVNKVDGLQAKRLGGHHHLLPGVEQLAGVFGARGTCSGGGLAGNADIIANYFKTKQISKTFSSVNVLTQVMHAKNILFKYSATSYNIVDN